MVILCGYTGRLMVGLSESEWLRTGGVWLPMVVCCWDCILVRLVTAQLTTRDNHHHCCAAPELICLLSAATITAEALLEAHLANTMAGAGVLLGTEAERGGLDLDLASAVSTLTREGRLVAGGTADTEEVLLPREAMTHGTGLQGAVEGLLPADTTTAHLGEVHTRGDEAIARVGTGAGTGAGAAGV